MKSSPWSAWCRKDLLNPDLQTILNPQQPIMSIIQKRTPGLWLTTCSKSRAAHCQHYAERPPDPDLHTVQNTEQPIVSVMQKRPSGPQLTLCSKPRAGYHQHNAEKPPGLWLTPCSKPKQPIVNIMQKRPPGPTLTIFLKPIAAHCQHHAEKVFLALTYTLFITQNSPLSALYKKDLLDPDLQSVQNPNNSIVSIMQKRPPRPSLTFCTKRKQYCQHHTEKDSWTPTYSLFKTQTIILSASCRKGLHPNLQPVQNPQPIVSIIQKKPLGPDLPSV